MVSFRLKTILILLSTSLFTGACGWGSDFTQEDEICRGNFYDGPQSCTNLDSWNPFFILLLGCLIFVAILVVRFVFRDLTLPLALIGVPLFIFYYSRSHETFSDKGLLAKIFPFSLIGMSITGLFFLIAVIINLVKERKRTKVVEQDYYSKGLEVFRNFVEREGHANVRVGYVDSLDSDEEFKLYVWCSDQLLLKNQPFWATKKAKEKILELDSLGFDWNPEETEFRLHFAALQQFYKREGHMTPRERFEIVEGEKVDLLSWTSHIQASYNGNIAGSHSGLPANLTKHNVAELEEFGFFNKASHRDGWPRKGDGRWPYKA